MKAKRFLFRAPSIFGSQLKYGAPIFIGFTFAISGLTANAGDILRGGSPASSKPARAGSGTRTPAATDAARNNAKDILARTNRTRDSIRNMQQAARQAALKNGVNNLGKNPLKPTITLPNVPNGLGTGGLKVSASVTTDSTKWTGAKLPVQQVKKNGKTEVTIKQTDQQAILNWETFNVGKKTTVTFDQSKGGADVGKWIAFNKINDPSGNPTQILGNIKADGQVYLINTNGIIFGGSSQVNARGLTVSSLPINDNLIRQGLLNNRDAQFLFSALTVPAGSDGTPAFVPEAPSSENGRYGDVTVQEGAILKTPSDSSGNGGRIMLVGPNVTNQGSIQTEGGQTILAAGLQVATAAHDANDPSLRGLDIWIGAVGDAAGTVINSGSIESLTGNVLLAGKDVSQLGMIDSSTSVALNGRIDIKASYGAVANPNFDSTTEQGSGGPMFLNQFTGTVTFGENSATRILPDYLSKDAVPGTALPERSQINVEGMSVHFDKDSGILAPNGEVNVRAGVWTYRDANNDRTILDADGRVEAGITNHYSGSTQRFLQQGGQIYVDQGAIISVAGSTNALVSIDQDILDIELRGAELADSPLQRDSKLRGQILTVDLSKTGTYNGKYWIGTPLGDVTGLVGLIERNAAQLTAKGGDINFQAGDSIVVRDGAVLDVSGGYLRHEAGLVKTSYLWKDGKLVAMENATPDQIYDGVFNGSSVFTSAKWGVSETFSTPLFSGYYRSESIEGAAGGTLNLSAPSMALDGKMRGLTVKGDDQRAIPPAASSIKIRFEADKSIIVPGSSTISYIKHSPAPPTVRFSNSAAGLEAQEFSLAGNNPTPLPDSRKQTVFLSDQLLGDEGFGSLELYNPDGDIILPKEVTLQTEAFGSITMSAANISIAGSIIAPGGSLSFTTYNISPTFAAEYSILNPTGTVPFPEAVTGRGLFTARRGAILTTSGLIIDDRAAPAGVRLDPVVINGGSISINSYNATLADGSLIDVSGGVQVSDKLVRTYGKGGSISIITGTDKGFSGVTGGKLSLGSTLHGFSGSTGGTLAIQSSLIQIGGPNNPDALNLDGEFFENGGFSRYSLSAIGAPSDTPPPAGMFESYETAINIADGVSIRPRATSLIAEDGPNGEIVMRKFVNDRGLRTPVSLSFSASGVDDPFTLDRLEIRGDIRMGEGASIVTDPGATVSFKAATVTLLGSVTTPGGTISVSGASAFPLTATQRGSTTQVLTTVHIGDNARLSAAGTVLLKPDPYGRRIGSVLNGGNITVSGNIIAEQGAVMNVSGTSGVLDILPSNLDSSVVDTTLATPGSTPLAIRGLETLIHSNGGTIDLTGSQMLVSDATLLGSATGGAAGGTLSISSGRYYQEGAFKTGADINLIVTQNGNIIKEPNAEMGVGLGIPDSMDGMGYFSLARFRDGGFSSLGLGGKYVSAGSSVPYGGNIEFVGDINLNVSGSLRLAAGGVIQATDSVNIRAGYLAVGQNFRDPANPDDVFFPFQKDPGVPTSDYRFAPTYSTGSISLSGKLVDVGTLSLQNIGSTRLTSIDGGDLRGNGTLSASGDIVLSAGQIYPTTASAFSIFAYDSTNGSGSVTIHTTGKASGLPASAGGKLSIYASDIVQGGVLQAPLGSITLGWDGIDLDPQDSDLDTPFNDIAGSTIAPPITDSITLSDGSLVSVSAAGDGNEKWLALFGISPDGKTWIDPRGENITLNGLSGKSITIAGDSVTMESGAVTDVRGGGDLLATRWVPGSGGSIDLLGSTNTPWSSGTEYQAGDLVVYNGEIWSSRVRQSGQAPQIGISWSKVTQSYAIIPSSSISALPYGAFNTGSNAGALSGDPGYVNGNLRVGDTITLDASEGVPAGSYVLLPSRYALLPGAFLVTPKSGTGFGAVTTSEGATIVSGYLSNSFNGGTVDPLTTTRFEIASAKVVDSRVTYETLSANKFLAVAADETTSGVPQKLPGDAGNVSINGNSALLLAGQIRTKSPGLGASIDVSSSANITISDGGSSGNGSISLDSTVLNSWKADSLLIGGTRRTTTDGSTVIDVRTDSLTLDSPGVSLAGNDVILVSNGSLEVTSGSSISSETNTSFQATALGLTGDGTLLRTSADQNATVTRTSTGTSTNASLSIGASAELKGASVYIDSTYATSLSPDTMIDADNLTLASGQIGIILDDSSGPAANPASVPALTLGGRTLELLIRSDNLTIRSYRSIDFYGNGSFGSDDLKSLTLDASSLRGFSNSGKTIIQSDLVHLGNSGAIAAPTSAGNGSSDLTIKAGTIRLGENAFNVSGFGELNLDASREILASGTGSFSTIGNLTAHTPLITGEAGAAHSINASGTMNLERAAGNTSSAGGLGATLNLSASSISANADILLPSGRLTLSATSGDLDIGGTLSVEGSSKVFNDLTRFANAGTITLQSTGGNITLGENANVSVAADSNGGNAGILKVITPEGSFTNNGSIHGEAGTSAASNGAAIKGKAGEFILDTQQISHSGFDSVNAALDTGGFFASRDFRIRSGDVTITSAIRSQKFALSTDGGSILVTGKIDASGKTGGSITLSARNNLTLANGSTLSVAAEHFDSAGKGGSIVLEAGTQRNGIANQGALLDLQEGASLHLGVNDYVAGSYTTPGSSAFEGKFTGILHLRAPRNADNTDLQIGAIRSSTNGVSSIVAEGFKVYNPANGVMNIALRNQINVDSIAFIGAAGVGNGNEIAIRSKLLNGAGDSSELGTLLVVAPGVEIVNTTGDLVLGAANNSSSGSTNQEALAAADWNLSGFRYGSRAAAGVLTLRAQGNLVFNNTLSDGFNPIAVGDAQSFADNGHSQMWLGTLMTVSDSLPTNTQSWSYRLTAGADTSSSNYRSVLSESELQPGKGSVLVGEFYPAVPNSQTNGTAAGVGTGGQTADSIRISSSTLNRGNRFEVIRTGTGDITVSAGRDIQLRNQFSTIYTAGVALPVSTTIYNENDFVVPVTGVQGNSKPSQQGSSGTLGATQQVYQPVWSMAGGNIALAAGANIGRYTSINGALTVDSSRQMPTNWLYRRSYVNPASGLFANDGGFGSNSTTNNANNINDSATSTTWWVDYSNFFQGIGTLGGGNIRLTAGNDVINVDAVAPTNARMAGRIENPDFGVTPDVAEYLNLAPNQANLHELGGGDVTITAGRNIDGGVYHVERGKGVLDAGGSITTNAARSPSLGILNGSQPLDPLTWMPTTLFVGKSHFDVTALGDVLLGPVSNPFLLPQGINNKYWYKTYFNTFSADAGVNVTSVGGDVTHRTEVNLPGGSNPVSILGLWYDSQSLFAGGGSSFNASNFQPWLRLAELDLGTFNSVYKLFAPNLNSTAMGGDIHLVGDITLSPSSSGNLQLVASGGIIGLNQTGVGRATGRTARTWTASKVNVSDANPESIPGILNPLAYQTVAGRSREAQNDSTVNILGGVGQALSETGSYIGDAASQQFKSTRHDDTLLHRGDQNPVVIYAGTGDITGLTLFTPKRAHIIAGRDISDTAFYLQNLSKEDISLVSAGSDIISFNETSELRSVAGNILLGNFIGDPEQRTVLGTTTKAMSGDIRISGPGTLEVLSGRNLDLGNGSNFSDGTGTGLTSIGNLRNPFLSFTGADIIALAGVTAATGSGAASGLAASSLNILDFIGEYLAAPDKFESPYLDKLGIKFKEASEEQQAIVALEKFYSVLRKTGRDAAKTGSYKSGYKAIKSLFGQTSPEGELLTRSREVRTTSGGSISVAMPNGGITMASEVFGNPLTPPGIVTEFGGGISTFTDRDVDLGQARIFTLRGGDIIMWSSKGNIAAGTSPRTVVTAPPTRVVIDVTSASVQTDLGGLATGGGIGVLATVKDVDPGNVDLIAPKGFVDAGDAGIRVSGNLNIAAQAVLNTGSISAAGSTSGTSASTSSSPSVATVTGASNATAGTTNSAPKAENKPPVQEDKPVTEVASIITVDVIGYGDSPSTDEDEDQRESPTEQ